MSFRPLRSERSASIYFHHAGIGRVERTRTSTLHLLRMSPLLLGYDAKKWSRHGDLRPAIPNTNRRQRCLCFVGMVEKLGLAPKRLAL